MTTDLKIQLCFYWILETNRRRVIHLTLIICTAGLSVGSEVVQGILPVRLSTNLVEAPYTYWARRMVESLTLMISLRMSWALE